MKPEQCKSSFELQRWMGSTDRAWCSLYLIRSEQLRKPVNITTLQV